MSNIVDIIVKICLMVIAGVGTAHIVIWIRKNTEKIQENINYDIVNKYISMLKDIVINCVVSTNQTYVDALKDKNAFDAEAQSVAYGKTRNAVMNIISDEMLDVLGEAYNDVALLIDSLIESTVHDFKKPSQSNYTIGF